MDIKQAVLDSFEELGWTEWPDDNMRVAELVQEKFTSTNKPSAPCIKCGSPMMLVEYCSNDGCLFGDVD
jgi:hypothetical protein